MSAPPGGAGLPRATPQAHYRHRRTQASLMPNLAPSPSNSSSSGGGAACPFPGGAFALGGGGGGGGAGWAADSSDDEDAAQAQQSRVPGLASYERIAAAPKQAPETPRWVAARQAEEEAQLAASAAAAGGGHAAPPHGGEPAATTHAQHATHAAAATAASEPVTYRLPDALWTHIFGYLPATSLARAAQVNAHWAEVSRAPYLWRCLCKHAMGVFHPDPAPKTGSSSGSSAGGDGYSSSFTFTASGEPLSSSSSTSVFLTTSDPSEGEYALPQYRLLPGALYPILPGAAGGPPAPPPPPGASRSAVAARREALAATAAALPIPVGAEDVASALALYIDAPTSAAFITAVADALDPPAGLLLRGGGPGAALVAAAYVPLAIAAAREAAHLRASAEAAARALTADAYLEDGSNSLRGSNGSSSSLLPGHAYSRAKQRRLEAVAALVAAVDAEKARLAAGRATIVAALRKAGAVGTGAAFRAAWVTSLPSLRTDDTGVYMWRAEYVRQGVRDMFHTFEGTVSVVYHRAFWFRSDGTVLYAMIPGEAREVLRELRRPRPAQTKAVAGWWRFEGTSLRVDVPGANGTVSRWKFAVRTWEREVHLEERIAKYGATTRGSGPVIATTSASAAAGGAGGGRRGSFTGPVDLTQPAPTVPIPHGLLEVQHVVLLEHGADPASATPISEVQGEAFTYTPFPTTFQAAA